MAEQPSLLERLGDLRALFGLAVPDSLLSTARRARQKRDNTDPAVCVYNVRLERRHATKLQPRTTHQRCQRNESVLMIYLGQVALLEVECAVEGASLQN